MNWLITRLEINYRKASMPQPDPRIQKSTALVGTTMKLRLIHLIQERFIDLTFFINVYYPDNSTHTISTHLIVS